MIWSQGRRVTVPDDANNNRDDETLTGEFLALGAAFANAMSSVAIAKGASTSSGESGVLLSAIVTGLLSSLAWMLFGGSAVAASETPSGSGAIWTATGWFVASGLLATVGGRITMFKSIEFAGVIRASTTRRLMPFISLLLSAVVIGETISPLAGGGMALIAVSFLLLYWDNRASVRISTDDPQRRAMISRGLAFGVGSATLYALSFIARKFGLVEVPNAFFGALIGSVTALCFYAGMSTVSSNYRSIVASALKTPNPWQLFAAFLMSAGQIMQFAALTLTSVGRVAFINSIEVFIAALLALAIFRTERMPGGTVIVATIVATAGVLLMAIKP